MVPERKVNISVVIPVYNEEGNINELYGELSSTLKKLNRDYEIIFIDDGSSDGTFDYLLKLSKKDKNLVVIKHRKNFGQTEAFRTGFFYARGEIIITMDGDLQNDPNDIPRLIDELENGKASVITGWRSNRKDPLVKKFFSKISNVLANSLTNLNIHDYGCSLRAYKAEVVKNLDIRGEMHRYMLAMISMKGYQIKEIKVNHRERKHGLTKYNIWRLIKGFLDLLFVKFWADYFYRPLHFFGTVGLFLLLLGGIAAFYKVGIQLILYHVPLDVGPLLLLSAVCVLTGIQFITLGFLSEFILRVYISTEKKSEQEKVAEVVSG